MNTLTVKHCALWQVARVFSIYFSQLLGLSKDIFQVQVPGRSPIDYLAFALVIVMTLACTYSIKMASHGNIGVLPASVADALVAQPQCGVMLPPET